MEESLVAVIRAELNQFRQDMLQHAPRIAQQGAQQIAKAMQPATQAIQQQAQATGRARDELGRFVKQGHDAAGATQQFGRASKQSASETNQFASATQAARNGLNQLKTMLAATGLVLFVRETIQASTQMQSFERSLKTATGSVQGAKAEIAFARAEAEHLGVSATASVEGITKLTNATRGTALAGEATRDIFTSLTVVNQSLGLSTEEYGRALLAVSQIALKGRVQQEELLQLAEAGVPVYRALSQTLGVTTAELTKMLEQGQVSATSLRGMFQVLRQEAGKSATEAAQSFSAGSNRIVNAVNDMLVVIGDLITRNPEVIRAMNESAATIRGLAESIRDASGPLKTFVGFFAQLASGAVKIAADELSGFTTRLHEMEAQNSKTEPGLARIANWIETIRQIVAQGLPFGDIFASRAAGETTEEIAKLNALLIEGKRITENMDLGEALLGGGEQGASQSAGAGLIEQRLNRYKEAFGDIKKLQDDIKARERDLADANILGFTPQQVQVLQTELDGLRDKLEKQIDPKGMASAKKGLSDAEREAKRFATTIDKLAGASLADLDRQLAALQERAAQTNIPGEIDNIIAAIAKLRTEQLELTLGDSFKRDMELARELEDTMTQAYEGMAEQVQQFHAEDLDAWQRREDLARDVQARMQQAVIDTTALELQQLDIQIEAAEAHGELRLDLLEARAAKERELMTKQTEFALEQLDIEIDAQIAANGDIVALERLRAAETRRILTEASLERQRLFDRDTQDAQRRFDRAKDHVSDVIFTWLDGLTSGTKTFQELWQDTLDSMLQSFLRMVSDMAAQALIANLGGLLLGGGGTGQIGAGILVPAAGAALSGSSGLGGMVGLGTGGAGLLSGVSTAATGALLGYTGPLSQGVFATALPGSAGTFGGAGFAAGTVGGVLGSALIGAAAGYGLRQLNDVIGITDAIGSRGSSALAGAGGGAIAGTLILPGIGTIIGAALGALLGGLLGGGTDEPSAHLQLRTAATNQGFLGDTALRGPFGFVGAGAAYSDLVDPGAIAEVFLTLDTALAGFLTQRQQEIAATALQHSTNSFQMNFELDKPFEDLIGRFTKDRMETILEGLSRPLLKSATDMRSFVDEVFGQFPEFPSKDDLQAMEQEFAAAAKFLAVLGEFKKPSEPLTQAEQALAALNLQFDQLRQQAMRYGVGLGLVEEARIKAIQNLFQTTIDTLEAQQKAVLQSIKSVQQGLSEALMTPAQVFVRRRNELEDLQAEFFAAGAGKQVSMVPDLLRRVQELFQLGQNEAVFGQDPESVERLQRQLLGFLEDVEQTAGRDAFNKQISNAEAQIDILNRINKVQEDQLNEMNATLRRMEKFLARAQAPFVGRFQEGGTVPATGLALVHRGETVLPPGQTTHMTIAPNITVQVQGGSNPRQTGQQIAEAIWPHLESMSKRRMINLRIEERR